MQLKRSGYGVACSVATALFWRRSKRDNEMSHWRRTGASIAEEGLWVLRLVCDASTRSRIAWTVAVEQERFELIAIRCFECSGILDDNELFSGHTASLQVGPSEGIRVVVDDHREVRRQRRGERETMGARDKVRMSLDQNRAALLRYHLKDARGRRADSGGGWRGR